jgi:2-dehydropantoate 2-reductase
MNDSLASSGCAGGGALVVVGAGGLGLSYAVALAAAGTPVTLVPSERSYEELVAVGVARVRGALDLEVALVTGRSGDASEIRVARPPELSMATGIIFATKTLQLPAATAALAGVDTPWVFGVQNGLGKDDVLAASFGRDRVLGGASTLPAERTDIGSAVLASVERTFVGELDAPGSRRVTEFVEVLRRAGLAVEAVRDAREVEWAKVMLSASGHGVHVLEHVLSVGSPSSSVWEPSQRAVVQVLLLREVGDVARAEGVEVQDHAPLLARSDLTGAMADAVARRMPTTRPQPTRGSMHQDLRSGRPVEADIFGDLVVRARRHGVDVPWLSAAFAAARTVNAQRTGSAAARDDETGA